jgi:hypothetical protein
LKLMATKRMNRETRQLHIRMSYMSGHIFYQSNQKNMSTANLCHPPIYTPHDQSNFVLNTDFDHRWDHPIQHRRHKQNRSPEECLPSTWRHISRADRNAPLHICLLNNLVLQSRECIHKIEGRSHSNRYYMIDRTCRCSTAGAVALWNCTKLPACPDRSCYKLLGPKKKLLSIRSIHFQPIQIVDRAERILTSSYKPSPAR